MKVYNQLKRLSKSFGVKYSINKIRLGKKTTIINLFLNVDQDLFGIDKEILILRDLLLKYNIDINIVHYTKFNDNVDHIDILDTRKTYMTGESITVCPIVTIGNRLNKLYNTHVFNKNDWYLNTIYINSLDIENHKIHYYASEVNKCRKYIESHDNEYIPKNNSKIAKFIDKVKLIRNEHINNDYILDYDTLYDDSDVCIIE